MTSTSRAAAFLRTRGTVAIAATAAVAYYLAVVTGLELRIPPATPSVLWPPNAVLTALLLYVPPRRWWSVLAGAAVAHFPVQLQVWSPGFVAGIFVTNCSEAVLAAGLIRRFGKAPARFDTLRRISVFLFAGAFLAPFASSFLDAAVVTVFNRESYWTVWRMRFLSNVLSQLAIVPAIAGVLNNADKVPGWPPRRWLEAAAIAGSLMLVVVVVSLDNGRIGVVHSPLALFLPVLLWTAIRFGSAGVGLSVLGTVVLAVISAVEGGGLFPFVPAAERITALQVLLISATMTVMCVGALVEERQRAAAALRSSDMLKSSILNSIPSLVAVIGRNGRIVAVNESWQHARANGTMPERSGRPGSSYLDEWAAAAERGSAQAQSAHAGITSVLDGSASGFALEYPSDVEHGDCWWLMSAVPLKSRAGGAVITHTDITARKRAEQEAQRSRDELAHTTRVWVMGELTAALSHQLNQPLTGIIGNAQAGRRLLATPDNLTEMRHILNDIIADAERASEMTGAVRDMLRKDVSEPEVLDVNEIVRDTIVLVRGEADARDVSLDMRLAPSLPSIVGKRVQLRQVVLNLTINAIEAITGNETCRARIVSVSTGSDPAGIRVSVVDTGCGLPDGAEEQIFEQLFTTKATGMGMGLPIARAIVEAHGGAIWADHSPTGGAEIHFTVPTAVGVTA